MPTRLTHLRITKIALVPAGANPEAHVLLHKSRTPPSREEESRMEMITKAVHDAQIAELEAACATLRADLAKAQATPPDPEDIWKGVNPAIKKLYDDQAARTRQAEEAIAIEKAARERAVYIGKAAGYKYLPIKPDDDWEVFKGVASLPAPVQERLEQILKAGEENGRLAALTTPAGRAGHSPATGDPLGRLEQLATELVSKGVVKSLEEGMQRATRDNPDLYRAYTRAVQREERD